VYRLY